MPTFRLLLFAGLKDAAKTPSVSLSLSDETPSIRKVWDAACAVHPELALWSGTVRFARNDAYVPDTEAVRAGDELAAIPPVSGG